MLPLPHVDGVEHRWVEARGVRFHVAEAGAGDPLVLLHGWPQHWWAWRLVIGPLAERFRVICPDFRGLGWSDGAHGSFRLDDLAADLVALLDTLGITEPVRLVGHDWGAPVGYRACMLRPERFARFVPLAAVHFWQGPHTPPAGFLAPWHVYTIATVGSRGVTRLNHAERALRTWRHNGAFSDDEAAVYLAAVRRPASVAATVRFDRSATFKEIPRALLKAHGWGLTVPTLHLNGERDPIVPHVPAGFRGDAIEAIPGCGHFIAEEAPGALLQRLDAFL